MSSADLRLPLAHGLPTNKQQPTLKKSCNWRAHNTPLWGSLTAQIRLTVPIPHYFYTCHRTRPCELSLKSLAPRFCHIGSICLTLLDVIQVLLLCIRSKPPPSLQRKIVDFEMCFCKKPIMCNQISKLSISNLFNIPQKYTRSKSFTKVSHHRKELEIGCAHASWKHRMCPLVLIRSLPEGSNKI